MKKTLLLVLPFLFIFIMSCETDDDETSGSLVGTWTIDSVTFFENGSCSGEGETDDYINGPFTGTITYTEVSATVSVGATFSLSSWCDEANGAMDNDTTCVYDGYSERTLSGFASDCVDDGGEFDDDNNCNYAFTEEFYYTYDEDSLGNVMYCEIFYDESESSNAETNCGTAVVTENSATLQFIEENDDDELECTVIVLSRQYSKINNS